MQDNAQMSKRNRKLEYLLCNARLRCGQCGSVMTGQFNPQREHRFYRCSRPLYDNPLPCRRTVSARAIEGPMWQKVAEALQNPELIASEVQRRAEHADTAQDTLTTNGTASSDSESSATRR
jgi:Recombinase zinc beta ribbon domain